MTADPPPADPRPADPRPAVAEVPPDVPIRVGALAFPGMDQIDLTGPFAVLCRLPNASVRLLAKETGPVADQSGLRLVPDATLADAGPIDLLVVPGGPGQEELMEDEAVLAFLRRHAATAACVYSVCTGALLLGAAGLLKGRTATTHWASVPLLRYFGATAVDRRVAVDGRFVSAAGLTAGVDGALTVAALLRGEAAAKAIQLALQYAPEPPFDCGSPASAPPGLLAEATDRFAPITARRLATAKRAAARLGVSVEDESPSPRAEAG